MPLVAMFADKKKKNKFADSGPPSPSEEVRGGGSGGMEEEEDMPPSEEGDYGQSGGDEGGDMASHESMAADDLADVLGVSPEDTGDFKNALKAYVSACIAMSEAQEPEAEGPPEEEG